MSQFKSTDDKRAENSGTRSKYRTLTDQQKFSVDEIKALGDDFLKALACYETEINDSPEAMREFSLAKTHLEDAVMRAVRGITQ